MEGSSGKCVGSNRMLRLLALAAILAMTEAYALARVPSLRPAHASSLEAKSDSSRSTSAQMSCCRTFNRDSFATCLSRGSRSSASRSQASFKQQLAECDVTRGGGRDDGRHQAQRCLWPCLWMFIVMRLHNQGKGRLLFRAFSKPLPFAHVLVGRARASSSPCPYKW